jgi:hypothetical protein
MKNLFFLTIIFFLTSLNSSTLDEKVENIIGKKDFKIHNSLVHLLFKDKNRYVVNGNINYISLFKTLQKNGLLNLKLNKTKDITIEFDTSSSKLMAFKILNDTMQSLGYRYFFTKTMDITNKNNMLWKIVFKAEYMIDPVELLGELKKYNCKAIDVVRVDSSYWSYKIDFSNSVINSIKIEKDERVKFQKPLKPYILKIQDAKSLQVISRNLNNWFPHIVFFDKDLTTLKVIKKNKITRGLTVKVPEDSRYIKITDMYNLINIKRGLSIIVR